MPFVSTRTLVLLLATAVIPEAASAEEPLVFVSAFAPGDKGGIEAFRLNLNTGTLTAVHRTEGVEHPFFIAVSPDQKFLYSIHGKTFGGKEAEEVAAYALEGRTGRMKLLNRQSSRGTASCYLDVDATGKAVLVANYSTGNVASYAVQPDGSLSAPVSFYQHAGGSKVDPARQDAAHAHCFVISPDNRFAFAADLGLDQVLSYRLDPAAGKLTPNQPPFAKTPAGGGPRHLTFHPNGKLVYVINELANTVTRFDYATATGTLTERESISTLPDKIEGKSYTADLKITPNGRFLYGTNRGHDSVAAYRIADDGRLTLIEIEPSLGKGPQNLAITGDGKWLICANMPGNNVVVFGINADTGAIQPVSKPVEVTSPSCIRILP